MIDLDVPEVRQRLDPDDMLGRIAELPQQCQEAWHKALNFILPSDYRRVNKVVVLGMGGSAMGGGLLAGLTAEEAAPVFVHRDYGLPSFVDAGTLLIASSYSGMTEETLSAFDLALQTPAKKLVLTTGGKMKAIAEERGIPVFTIAYQAQPRAALAHSFIPLIGILHKLELISDKSKDIAEMVQVLGKLKSEIDADCPLARNPAKQLATKLFGRIAIIYGAGILSEVARRWKTQLNENSKAWAFFELFPELNHNAIVGYEFPHQGMDGVFVVLLRSSKFGPRILARYQVTCDLLEQRNIDHEVVEGNGQSALSQIMSLIMFGDYVSYYLAMLNEVDPTPVQSIDYLKKRLSEA